MWHIELSTDESLRLLDDTDVERLHAVIEANRSHLARWMPWAASQTLDDTRTFVERTRVQIERNDGFQAAVVSDGQIVGMVGFRGVSWHDRATSVGYWLAASAQGQGRAARAVEALLGHAFDVWQLDRVEIRAGVDNVRSQRVAERLGFHREGIVPDAESIGGRHIDHVVYAMSASDWRRTIQKAPGAVSDVVIRPSRPDEAEAILQLWREAGSSHASAADGLGDVRRLLAQAPGSLLVADLHGAIVGTLIAAWDGWRGNMYRLAVHADHRRHGIGLALVRAGEQHLRQHGARRITALVAYEDEIAAAFWENAGYPQDRDIGRRVRNLS